ncbi:MAG: nuclear transport factor 2 family protein [Flavobacteriaceae bacterium]|nr:nuclear transport factor 2 family protein [Flavobacteriaceae bacterium]
MKVKFITLLVVVLCNESFHAQTTKEVSDDYLANYTSLNFDKLCQYYTDDSIFEDATMSYFSQDQSYQKPVGAKNIVSFLKEGFAKISNVNYAIKEQYQAGIMSFYYGTLHYDYEINNGGEPKTIQFNLPLAIVLKIENGKVIHHQDIADYNVWMEQYNKQVK